MKLSNASVFVILLLTGGLVTQQKTGNEVDIHKNVRLIEMTGSQDMPEELQSRYQTFLPLFIEALKENTSAQAPEKALTIRIAPGVKEIGSAKTKRVFVTVTAYQKNTRNEYVGNLLLHSYATGGNVNKEEIGQFLSKQILGPLGIS